MSIVTTALKKIYDEEGIEVYLDKYRYCSLAEDYISDRDDRFLELLYFCADNGILRNLYELHQETSDKKRERLFQKGKLLFVQNKKYSEEDASAFFQYYCDTFGWKMPKPEPVENKTSTTKQTSTPEQTSIPKQTSAAAGTTVSSPVITPARKAARTTVQRPSQKRKQTKPARRKKHRLRYFLILLIAAAAIADSGIVNWYSVHLDDLGSIVRKFTDFFIDSPEDNESGMTTEEESPQTGAVVLTEAPQFDTSVYQPVTVTGGYASSVVVQENIDNSPKVMFDGVPETSWQEGVDGYGVGETAGGYFDQFYQVKYISFLLGNWRSYDLFYKNCVPYALNLTLGDFSQDIYFSTDRNILENEQWVEFTEPVRADSLELEILGALPGNKYVETCISEITIYGIKE